MRGIVQSAARFGRVRLRSFGGLLLLVALGACLAALNGCGGAQGAHGAATATQDPRVTPTFSGVTPASSPTTATPSPTTSATTLNFTLVNQIQQTQCATPQQGTTCQMVTGSGSSVNLGQVKLSRAVTLKPSQSGDSCGPSTTQGTLTSASGDTLTFSGTGTFCQATLTLRYDVTITGGSGRFAHASGAAHISMTYPQTSLTSAETWAGSFTA